MERATCAAFGGEIAAASRPDMIRVSPDAWLWKPRDPQKVPQYGLLKWVPVNQSDSAAVSRSDGSTAQPPDRLYRPVPLCSRFAMIDAALLEFIGFRRINRMVRDDTLMRLAAAEEITIIHIAPKVRMLDIDSWYRYLDDCMANPDKWEPGSPSWDNYIFRNGLGKTRKAVKRSGSKAVKRS